MTTTVLVALDGFAFGSVATGLVRKSVVCVFLVRPA